MTANLIRTRTTTVAWVLVSALFALVAIGCGSGKFFVPLCQETGTCPTTGTGTTPTTGSAGASSEFVYVANSNQGTLAAFPIPGTGLTSLTGGASYNLGTPPSALAATPKGTFLYVGTASGSVFVYIVNRNGTLALGNGGSPVTSTLNPTWMTVDRTGNWLFLVSNSSNQLLIFQINPFNGVLTQTNQGTIALSTGNPTQVYATPDNLHVYVGLGTGGTDGFLFNAFNGTLSNQLHLPPRINGGSSDNSYAADNKSAYLFIGEAGTGIRVLSIAANGMLNEISGSPFTSNSQLGPASIVVDPTNKYVYVAYRTTDSIGGYSLASTGALTPLSSSPFQTGFAPTQMSLDSSGKYVFVINAAGNPDLQAFQFDSTTAGKLDLVTSTTTGVQPAGAISMALVP